MKLPIEFQIIVLTNFNALNLHHLQIGHSTKKEYEPQS